MIEAYKDMLISLRKHRDGSFSAEYGGGDLILSTNRHHGNGAMKAALEQAKREIDELTPEKIADLLGWNDDYEE